MIFDWIFQKYNIRIVLLTDVKLLFKSTELLQIPIFNS